MATNRWMMTAVGLSLGLSCYALVQIGELKEERAQAYEAQIDRAKAKQGRIAEVELRIARISRRLKRVAEQPRHETRIVEGEGQQETASVTAVAAELEEVRADLERVIAEQVQEQVGQKIQQLGQRKRNQSGEWEPPMNELADELRLNPEQDEAARAIFDESRDEVFALFKTARADGGNLADDVADDLKTSGEPGAAMKRFFKRMASDTVPGTDRTYLAELIRLRGHVFESLDGELSEEQMVKLKTLRIDPLQVGTGYDPMKAYIEQRMQE